MSKMALIGLCLLLLMSTINSLSQGQKLYNSFIQWHTLKPLWSQANSAPATLETYTHRLRELSKGNERVPQIDLNDPLDFARYLEQFCQGKNLRLTRLPEAKQQEESGIQVQDTRFSLEGSLADILGLLYQIEYQDQLGQVVHLNLETQSFRQDGQKRKFLFAHITLQKPFAI